MDCAVPHRRAAGFTLVELLMAMGIVAMILGAVAGLSYAMSSAWRSGETVDRLQMVSRQCMAQLERNVSLANYVLLATADGQTVPESGAGSTGATLVLWQDDGDLSAKLGEMRVIQRDRATGQLRVYQARAGTSTASMSCSLSDTATSAQVEQFKKLDEVDGYTLATGVSEARFVRRTAGATTQYPSVELVLTFAEGDSRRTEYRTVALRVPVGE